MALQETLKELFSKDIRERIRYVSPDELDELEKETQNNRFQSALLAGAGIAFSLAVHFIGESVKNNSPIMGKSLRIAGLVGRATVGYNFVSLIKNKMELGIIREENIYRRESSLD